MNLNKDTNTSDEVVEKKLKKCLGNKTSQTKGNFQYSLAVGQRETEESRIMILRFFT